MSGQPGRWQRPFIGPFSMLQTVAVLVAVFMTALVLVFINTPLANPQTPGLPTPGSRFVPLEGNSHWWWTGDTAAVVREILA